MEIHETRNISDRNRRFDASRLHNDKMWFVEKLS